MKPTCMRLARAVPRGHVFAVDIEPEMVSFLDARARKEGLSNLTSMTGEPNDPRLPVAVDLILMVDVYHHLSDRVGYLRTLRPLLKPGGRIAIIDHIDTPDGNLKNGRAAPRRLKDEIRSAG